MKEHDCRGIVLAGRPYHIDPEINHGIPETICSLGMVVLSEDSICELQPGEKLHLSDYLSRRRGGSAQAQRQRLPPRGRPQGHHPHAAARDQPVGLTIPACTRRRTSWPPIRGSNSCSSTPSAAAWTPSTTDQVAEILADKADVYTMLKIDEVSNLGAAKIRLRSLKAAVEERESKRRARRSRRVYRFGRVRRVRRGRDSEGRTVRGI